MRTAKTQGNIERSLDFARHDKEQDWLDEFAVDEILDLGGIFCHEARIVFRKIRGDSSTSLGMTIAPVREGFEPSLAH
jgi:hypothetical protein